MSDNIEVEVVTEWESFTVGQLLKYWHQMKLAKLGIIELDDVLLPNGQRMATCTVGYFYQIGVATRKLGGTKGDHRQVKDVYPPDTVITGEPTAEMLAEDAEAEAREKDPPA